MSAEVGMASDARSTDRRRRASATVAWLVVASLLGCDREPAAQRAQAEPPGAPPAAPDAARDEVPPLPERFGLAVVHVGEGSLTLSPDSGSVWTQAHGEEPRELGVLAPAQRAALWRLLHERGFTRLRSPARGLPGETIVQVMPDTLQAAHVRGQEPPGFPELVAALEAALREARPPAPPAPRSLVVFVADPPANEAPREDGRIAARSVDAQGTWLEADGTVAREDRAGPRLVGLLPEAGRAEVWALFHRSGFFDLALGDPGGPAVLVVWVDGRERRVTREPGEASPELLELQRLVHDRLGADLTPVPPPTAVPPRPADFSFTLGHGGGAAAQWDEVIVAPDGAVARRSREEESTPAGRVEPDVMDAVWLELHTLRFFELGSEPGNMTDAITVTADGREHRAAYSMGAGPLRFRILLASLRARVQ
jgi:hypothetical protein